MRILRISRTNPQLSVLSMSFVSNAARMGTIFVVWIILMKRFDVSPVLSGICCICVQGFAVGMKPLSEHIFRHISVLKSQRYGALLGSISVMLLVVAQNITMFLIVTLALSVSKVALESTIPRTTHKFLIESQGFAPKLVGTQQSAVLFMSLIVMPFAMANNYLLPALFTAIAYFVCVAITFVMPMCGDDNFVQVNGDGDDSQE